MSSCNNHPSIQMINNKYENSFSFKFESVSTDQVTKLFDELMKLTVIKVQAEIYQNKLQNQLHIVTYQHRADLGILLLSSAT